MPPTFKTHRKLSPLSLALVLLTSGCAAHRLRTPNAIDAPVLTADSVRETLPNDYLRITFVPKGVTVSSLARPGAIRGFATATALYEPPLRLKDFPIYSGLINNDQQVLTAIRCRPVQPENVDAELATWPNVFAAVQKDTNITKEACSASTTDPATKVACLALNFNDLPASSVPTTLARAFDYAAELYAPGHEAEAKWLQDKYGIFAAFAGTGYSIKDSYYLDKQPMNANQILSKSASSEFILKNVSLADANCQCISVEPYQGRENDLMDPAFISRAGGAGSCRSVPRLPSKHAK